MHEKGRTEVAETAAALRGTHDGQRLFASIVASLPDATFAIDAQKRIVAWNRACEALTGVRGEGLLGQGDYAYAEPFFGTRRPTLIDFLDVQPAELDGLYDRVERAGDVIHAEIFNPRLRGGVGAHLSASAFGLFDAQGGRLGAVEILRDVTDHKRIAQALQESRTRLLKAQRVAGVGFVDWDLKTNEMFLSEWICELTGSSPEGHATTPEFMARMVHPDDLANALENLDLAIRGVKPYDIVHRHVLPNGTIVWVRAQAELTRDEDGTPSRLLGTIVDVTRLKRVEQSLRENTETLEQRVEARTAQLAARNQELKDFAYTVSHDLKAPLRGIAGYAAELARKHAGGLSERARFCLTQILSAAGNLDRLIEDLLRYSRLDAETPSLADVNLRDLVDGVLRDRQLAIAEQQVELTVDVPSVTLRAWERGLVQVLANLVDNALKYSRHASPPRVWISAETGEGSCRLIVRDNGVGFDMKYHDRIFGLFNRLVRMEDYEGTGAGLAIVRKVLDKQGGRIRAEAAPGEGATFFVELPCPRDPE